MHRVDAGCQQLGTWTCLSRSSVSIVCLHNKNWWSHLSHRRPYNLYCVGGDVKPCLINQSIIHIFHDNNTIHSFAMTRNIYIRPVVCTIGLT